MSDMQPIILAGGIGERFWPLSTPDRPKQLLCLDGSGKSLLQQTVERLRLCSARTPWVQTSRPQLRAVQAHLTEKAMTTRVYAEPGRRDTGPAMAWAAQKALAELGPEAILGFFPADPWIPDGAAFAAVVQRAVAVAADERRIVTIGIKPTRAETGYGYIEPGAALGEGAFAVAKFNEKPDAKAAAEYWQRGQFFWNAGMFVAMAGVLADEFKRHAPDIWQPLIEQGECVYDTLPKLSVDYALIEKSDRIAVVPGNFAWDDLGDWAALQRLGLGGQVVKQVQAGASGNVVYGDHDDFKVILLGVDNVVVALSGRNVLVAKADELGRLKEALKRMNELG